MGSENSLSGLQMAAFLLCPPMTFSCAYMWGKRMNSVVSLFIRLLMDQGSPLQLHLTLTNSLEAPNLRSATRGARASIYELAWETGRKHLDHNSPVLFFN